MATTYEVNGQRMKIIEEIETSKQTATKTIEQPRVELVVVEESGKAVATVVNRFPDYELDFTIDEIDFDVDGVITTVSVVDNKAEIDIPTEAGEHIIVTANTNTVNTHIIVNV